MTETVTTPETAGVSTAAESRKVDFGGKICDGAVPHGVPPAEAAPAGHSPLVVGETNKIDAATQTASA